MRKWVLAVMSIHRDVVGLDHLAPVVRLALDQGGQRLRAKESRLHALQGRALLHVGRLQGRSEEHTSELQSPCNLVCRLLLEKKKKNSIRATHRDSCRRDPPSLRCDLAPRTCRHTHSQRSVLD